jgi:hypothetical protein
MDRGLGASRTRALNIGASHGHALRGTEPRIDKVYRRLQEDLHTGSLESLVASKYRPREEKAEGLAQGTNKVGRCVVS